MALPNYNMADSDNGVVTPLYNNGSMTVMGIIDDNDNTTYSNFTESGSSSTCLTFRFTLYVCVMGLLCFLGFIGNTVSFLVLGRDRSTPVASFLLQVLAVADNLMLIFWSNHFIVGYFMEFIDVSWFELPRFVWFYRIYAYPILFIAQTETIWLTVVIALNRYMAVCLPYRAPHLCTITNVYKEVVTVTLFSILYNLPRFFVMNVGKENIVNGTVVQNLTTYYEYTEFGESNVYKLVYMDTLYYLVSFVLPLLILAFVNTRVTIAYKAARRRRRRMTSRRSENENNITLVMIIVVLTFMLCQAPARIVQLVWNYKFQDCTKYRFKYYAIHISNTLEALNSSINFGIYFLFRKRFRDILWQNYCFGPLAMKHRRDSQRGTTTEGLSLEEMRQSSSRKTSSQKSSKESQKNGCVMGKQALVSTPEVKVEAEAAGEDTKPLALKQDDQNEAQDSGQSVENDEKKDEVLKALV